MITQTDFHAPKISGLSGTHLYTTDWTNEVKHHTNVNSAYNAFSDIVLNAINQDAPEYIVHVSAKSRTIEPWVTKGIHQSGKKLR